MPPRPQRLDAGMPSLYYSCAINARSKCYQSMRSQQTIAMLSMRYYTINALSMLHRHWVPAPYPLGNSHAMDGVSTRYRYPNYFGSGGAIDS